MSDISATFSWNEMERCIKLVGRKGRVEVCREQYPNLVSGPFPLISSRTEDNLFAALSEIVCKVRYVRL